MKFELSAREQAAAEMWIVGHSCPIEYEGAIGGKITYSFSPTGIGTAIEIQCGCGAFENVTDYSQW